MNCTSHFSGLERNPHWSHRRPQAECVDLTHVQLRAHGVVSIIFRCDWGYAYGGYENSVCCLYIAALAILPHTVRWLTSSNGSTFNETRRYTVYSTVAAIKWTRVKFSSAAQIRTRSFISMLMLLQRKFYYSRYTSWKHIIPSTWLKLSQGQASAMCGYGVKIFNRWSVPRRRWGAKRRIGRKRTRVIRNWYNE